MFNFSLTIHIHVSFAKAPFWSIFSIWLHVLEDLYFISYNLRKFITLDRRHYLFLRISLDPQNVTRIILNNQTEPCCRDEGILCHLVL